MRMHGISTRQYSLQGCCPSSLVLGVTAFEVAGIHGKWIDMVVSDEHLNREAELTHIMSAMSLLNSPFRRNNPAKNECGQNGNDRNNCQQLDKAKCPAHGLAWFTESR